jgi:hypothetical protein
MNALSNYYGPDDGRYHSAKALETVLSYAIESLSDSLGGTITLLPMNELEDITVIYRRAAGGVQIGQINLQEDEATSIDISEDDLPALLAAIRLIPQNADVKPPSERSDHE